MPAEVTDFLAPAFVHYPRQVEAHIEFEVDEIAGIADNFALQEAADGGRACYSTS